MITINDYERNPEIAVKDFEQTVGNYTGAPFVVATDSCTHAIELCLRYLNPKSKILLPENTYLSIPMTVRKLDLKYKVIRYKWYNEREYLLGNTNIWDSARLFKQNMYEFDTFKCVSFGHGKPLSIGRGGAILLDNKEAYEWLKRASYDGRNLEYNDWVDQKYFHIGYHYMMRPEEAVRGLNLIDNDEISHKNKFSYPNIEKITIL